MCYPVYGGAYKRSLAVIEKSSPSGDSGLPLSLSESFFNQLKYKTDNRK